jgi:hypothetical protein
MVLPNSDALLGSLPRTLRNELVIEYSKLARNYRESKWESAEMNGGKLCEVIYSIIDGYITGSYPVKASKPKDMVSACRQLEQSDSSILRSIKIQIPRVLTALYEVRNNRNVGHTGGDVNPSAMDATYVFNSARWLVGELIRIFHDVGPDEAQKAVDMLAERIMPIIWDVNGKKRVLSTSASMTDQTLMLLHQVNDAQATDLSQWVGYSNFSTYKSKVLSPGHKKRWWEYDAKAGSLTISPLGITLAEHLLEKYAL